MLDLSKYEENLDRNNIILQMALRDIDASLLVTAMTGMDERTKEIVFRNMSKRAIHMLKEDIREMGSASPSAVEAAREFFARLLEKHEGEIDDGISPSADPEPPIPDLGSEEGIIASFCLLVDFVKRNGLLPLEPLIDALDDPLMRKGLLMLVEGWDPLLQRAILERYKESYLRNLGLKMDLVIEGLDSLSAKDNSLITEQKLRSLVARL